jgi:hypothetical protein
MRSTQRDSALRDNTTSPLISKIAGILLISLAIGMIFAGKYDVASANYIYVFLCTVGLFASEFDRWVVRAK